MRAIDRYHERLNEIERDLRRLQRWVDRQREVPAEEDGLKLIDWGHVGDAAEAASRLSLLVDFLDIGEFLFWIYGNEGDLIFEVFLEAEDLESMLHFIGLNYELDWLDVEVAMDDHLEPWGLFTLPDPDSYVVREG